MPIKNTNFTFEEIDYYFKKAKKIFFIGIGGVSMGSLAKWTAINGKRVYGYDRERKESTRELEKIAEVKHYSTPDNVSDMDMVIFTNAIDENNFEYKRAKKMGIPLVSRANFLGYIASLHENRIGVCGSHGKSTTTSLISHIFDVACKNPTCFCGAEMMNFSSCERVGGREVCIYEACEYLDSFLNLKPTHAVITNVDFDHPDYFSSLEDVKKSFSKYIADAKKVFINCDDENSLGLTHPYIITYGFSKKANYMAEIEEKNEKGQYFTVFKNGERLCRCFIGQAGKHMVYNSLCAFAVAHTSRIPQEVIKEAISTFKGSKRRFEFVRKTDTGACIFEDYAHHPTEIKASISSAKEMGYKKIMCVFQPHTFSRTYYLYNEFVNSFKDVSKLIIYPVFSAREKNVYELSEEKFAHDCNGEYIVDKKKIALEINTSDCDCILLLGAGDLSEKMKAIL